MVSRALILALLLSASSAAAAKSPTVEQVIAVKPDLSMVLSISGSAFFADLIFPDTALAQDWFAQHLLQQKIGISNAGNDRYGRVLIESQSATNMLRAGIAVIYADTDTPVGWQAAEQGARQTKTGLWANADFILTSKNAAQHFGQFHLVEGTVTNVYRGQNKYEINFGDDWHTDFSIAIQGRVRKAMVDQLAALKAGSRIRVRGTVIEDNGPMIRVSHRNQLEIL